MTVATRIVPARRPGATARWWTQPTPVGVIAVVAGAGGVHRISFDASTIDTAAFVGTARPGRDRAITRELDDWFAGARQRFSVPVVWPADLTPFARRVLETLAARVPWGETVSYGELAELAQRPGAARGVGRVMAGNPVPFVVPCHRVIAAGGRIGGYGGGRNAIAVKRWLLEHEGVHLRA